MKFSKINLCALLFAAISASAIFSSAGNTEIEMLKTLKTKDGVTVYDKLMELKDPAKRAKVLIELHDAVLANRHDEAADLTEEQKQTLQEAAKFAGKLKEKFADKPIVKAVADRLNKAIN